jgi:hypothetical protein
MTSIKRPLTEIESDNRLNGVGYQHPQTKDIQFLQDAKKEEKRMKARLVRVNISNGYVMTKHPERYRHIAR